MTYGSFGWAMDQRAQLAQKNGDREMYDAQTRRIAALKNNGGGGGGGGGGGAAPGLAAAKTPTFTGNNMVTPSTYGPTNDTVSAANWGKLPSSWVEQPYSGADGVYDVRADDPRKKASFVDEAGRMPWHSDYAYSADKQRVAADARYLGAEAAAFQRSDAYKNPTKSAPTAAIARPATKAPVRADQAANTKQAAPAVSGDEAAFSKFFNANGITDEMRKSGKGLRAVDNPYGDKVYAQGPRGESRAVYTGMGAPSRIAAEKARAEDPAFKRTAAIERLTGLAERGNEQAAGVLRQMLQSDSTDKSTAAAAAYNQERIGVDKQELKQKHLEADGAHMVRVLGAIAKATEVDDTALANYVDIPVAKWPDEMKRVLARRQKYSEVYSSLLQQLYGLQEPAAGGKPKGGAIGYAAGGMVEPAAQPDMLTRQYGQYVSSAMQAGVQPLSMDKFTALLLKTRTQMAQAPAQAGAPGMQLDNPGSGAPMGFAGGGAIDVAGRQVLGPGDGKSDSIPAVIDGQQPAKLSTGEFVFPVEAVQFFGMDRLNKMVAAARKQGQRA